MTKRTKKDINAIFKKYQRDRDNLIPILQAVQKKLKYISEEAVEEIAEHLDVSENEIYGVASFYAQFKFERPGDHKIQVCEGTACHVKGSQDILDKVCKTLGIKPGETTPDYKFSLERVACVGSCALSPLIAIDGEVYGRMTPEKVRQLLKEFE